MPPPLPVPSKAAIHALRGIALGTSCAIGVIVEDRRRKISTLKTAISNKEKLKSARQYHGTVNPAALELDDTIFVGDELHWHQLEGKAKTPDNYPLVKSKRPRNSTHYASLEAGAAAPSEPEYTPESSSSTTAEARSSSTQHVQRTAYPSLNNLRQQPTFPQARTNPTIANTYESRKPGETTIPKQQIAEVGRLAKEVALILDDRDEERLDRAISKFFEFSQILSSSKQFDDEWIALSAQLSRECQEKDRWEDATEILSLIVKAGPLDESQFYAHEPLPIIEFWLRQTDKNGQCPSKAISVASRLFLTTFKEKPLTHCAEVERIGKQLLSLNLPIGSSIIHNIYWRVLGILEDPMIFTGWAIQQFYQYEDHKSVVKFFQLNFSKTSPNYAYWNQTIDCVINSVESLRGWKANQVLRALGQMKGPGNGFLRSRWLMRLLQAHWHRNKDFPGAVAFFEEILSMGLLNKVNHPFTLYRNMIEISIEAGKEDIARSYYDKLITKYPDMSEDVAIKGFVALALAKAGDWSGVFDIFSEMQALRNGHEKEHDNAFVMILKVFAESHPVSEVRNFVTKYTSDLGVGTHHYIVTIVANKYGECHDMPGFLSWLTYCSEAGFALDSGLCNAVLHNCRTKWGFSYRELQVLYLKIREIDPTLINDVTRRIMSQSGLTAGKSISGPLVTVNKLAYRGRTTNRRDVYEAMNQELKNGKPATSISIYKRALNFGMPPCRYCLRLAVLAALENSQSGFQSALTLIHTAHERGDDVGLAVSAFMRFQLDNIQAGAQDILMFMQNLVRRFEAMHIIIDPTVLTHMAMICTRLGHQERAIALCRLATERGGHANACFSRQSIKALLTAYLQLLDHEEMKKLVDEILASKFSADKSILLHLKSIKRTIQRYQSNATVNSMLATIHYGIEAMVGRRAEVIKEGKMISEETLRIMQDAAADMEKKRPKVSQDSSKDKSVSQLLAVDAE